MSEEICDKDGTYFVFHGTSRSRDPKDWVYPSSGVARTTIIGHGNTRSAAFDDAKRHEFERGYDFSGIGHVSGPHRRVYAAEHDMDWDLSGDGRISDDARWDRENAAQIMRAVAEKLPDDWFPHGKITQTIKVRSVIGTGDPLDVFFVIPLIHSHGYPPNCCFGEIMDGPACGKPVQRLLVLEEAFQGHRLLSACEAHYRRFDRPRDYAMDPRD